MLSKSEVADLIEGGSIGITYAFDPADLATSHVANPLSVQLDSRGRQLFAENFFGNRLSITLGPLVYSHNYKGTSDRKNFKERESVFDLRETEGRIVLRPGENITVNSIESVRLGERWGAITLPRLTHATVGVVLSASYIDPLWDGVLVFHIVNHGKLPIELQIGEKIGACHFYQVASTDSSNSDASLFASKSHHFGQSWKKIIDGDADPFPQKKKPSSSVSNSPYLAVRQFLKDSWAKLLGGIGIISLLGALLWVGAAVQDFRDLPADVEKLQHNAISAVERTVTVPIAAGANSSTQTISAPTEDDFVPILVFASPRAASSEAKIDASFISNEEGARTIRLVTTVDAISSSDRLFDVNYVVVLKNEKK